MVVCVWAAAYRDRATCFRLSELLGLRMAQLWNNSRDCWIFPSNRMIRAAHTNTEQVFTRINWVTSTVYTSVLLTAQYTVYCILLFKSSMWNSVEYHWYTITVFFFFFGALCLYLDRTVSWQEATWEREGGGWSEKVHESGLNSGRPKQRRYMSAAMGNWQFCYYFIFIILFSF